MATKTAKKVKLLMADVGRCVRVKWDDGTVDAILVQLDSPSDPGRYAKVFDFNTKSLQVVCLDQIVSLGERLTPNFKN